LERLTLGSPSAKLLWIHGVIVALVRPGVPENGNLSQSSHIPSTPYLAAEIWRLKLGGAE